LNALTGWCVVRQDGSAVVEIGADVTEDDAWQIALAWPDATMIRDAKRQGARAFRCRVVEVSDERPA
jgi:hypothetical protein